MAIRRRRISLRWKRSNRRWKFLHFLLLLLFTVGLILFKSPGAPPSPLLEYRIPECDCSRAFLWPPNSSLLPLPLNSTCSDEGTFHYKNQNVISFSLHMSPRLIYHLYSLYVEGLQLNLKAASELYPNFTIRIYTDHQLHPEDDFCSILCDNNHVFWCNVREIPNSKLANTPGFLAKKQLKIWRFLPLGDPTVDVFLSRDLDSVVTPREATAVYEWLELGRGIHLMRDRNQPHGPRFKVMPGGLWGARNSLLENPGQLLVDIIRKSYRYRNKTGVRNWRMDSEILENTIYHARQDEIVAHTSFDCEREQRSVALWRPFSTQRQGPEPGGGFKDFVGNNILRRNIEMYFPTCPLACRPDYGKHWEYC